MLELSALAEVEEALRAEGFFGAEGVVADVYLGYGLSAALRRTDTAGPPEPCPRLPAAAVSIRPAEGTQMLMSTSFEVGAWTPTWSEAGYGAAVEAVRVAIARGDVYQVNLVQHLSASFTGDPAALAATLVPLAPLHPEPLVGEGWAIVSASPELFLARKGRKVWTRPIKGTAPAGEPVESAKDLAEHVMIVDLERNDLSRVCEPGSILSLIHI